VIRPFTIVLLLSAALLLPAGAARAEGVTFVVTKTVDTDDGACDADCSLREAITASNELVGRDTIAFNIPGDGVQMIQPISSLCVAYSAPCLPIVSDATLIDGFTQPGAVPGVEWRIRINGSLAGTNADGLGLFSPIGDVTVRGLMIDDFRWGLRPGYDVTIEGNRITNTGVGILIHGGFAITVGGPAPEQGNVISDSRADGIYAVFDGTPTLHTITGNTISGSGQYGVRLDHAMENVITDNVVTSNKWGGFLLYGWSDYNLVSGNTILNNSYDGIVIAGSDARQISGNVIEANQLEANEQSGIQLDRAAQTVVAGNTLTLNGREGVFVIGGSSNTIGGATPESQNTILSNGGNGVTVIAEHTGKNGQRNRVLGNTIHDNAGLGIDIADDGPTMNDAGDSDDGPNERQNVPDLTAADVDGQGLAVSGSLDSKPHTNFRIEVFGNAICDSSTFGEGETFLASYMITSDASGSAQFSVEVPWSTSTRFISATATDSSGNTSEFSACQPLDCTADGDCDGVSDGTDNCPAVANGEGQDDDSDGDLAGDACDAPGSANVDCNGAINSVDALKVLRYAAGLSITQSEPCLDIGEGPLTSQWNQGDVDCSGGVNSVDALLVLRSNATLPLVLPPGCPEPKQ
jgi:CSLREA domain-containing protein